MNARKALRTIELILKKNVFQFDIPEISYIVFPTKNHLLNSL